MDLAISITSEFGIETNLFCDTSHLIERDNVKTIIVPKGPDSVDFTLVNALSKHDIVITQDNGLAAMVLARGGYPINQNGREISSENIERLLVMLVKKLEGQGAVLRDLKKERKKTILRLKGNFGKSVNEQF